MSKSTQSYDADTDMDMLTTISKCSLCGSPSTNKTTCPANPQAVNPDPNKHKYQTVTAPKPKRTIDYVPVQIKKDKTGVERLSARHYYDNHGEDITIGDRCDIRKDREYKCLLMRTNGSPYWAQPSKSGAGQEVCGDWSSRCKIPQFAGSRKDLYRKR